VGVLLSIVVLAADGVSDSGGKDAGESASAWHVGGALFWTLIVVLALVVLVAALVINARRPSRPRTAPAPAPPPPPADGPARPRAPREVHPHAGWDLAVLTFDHLGGAERAFADVRQQDGAASWIEDVAFVEAHRHGRITLRGTFAGRYVDEPDLVAAEGRTALATELRADVPEGSSGLVAFAPPDEVERFVNGLRAQASALARHTVSAEEASMLEAGVASAPAATAPEEA